MTVMAETENWLGGATADDPDAVPVKAVVGAPDMTLGKTVELIVDELITNAVLHACWTDRPGNRPAIELVLGERAGWFAVEVLDGDERLPTIAAGPDFSSADVDAADVHGIGLWSVESMVALWHGYWGWAPDVAGKVVWLSLPTTEAGASC